LTIQTNSDSKNILQHLQSDRRFGASIKLLLNLPVQFYLNKVSP